ncbi:hypothetical protein HY386_00475 [Candidatus Daviesbacteria bacterium]|nr:hypothetical protein [Candidatus Daviesbacteria bacterium]
METLLGLSTIDCARKVVSQHPDIRAVNFRRYIYVPQKPSWNDEVITRVTRDCFLSGFDPCDLIGRDDNKSNIALDSTLEITAGRQAFLLMMDLQPTKSAENQALIMDRYRSQVLPWFGGGFLIETGSSYQLLGMNITDREGWYRFMGRCLLMSTPLEVDGIKKFIEVPDTRYCGFSLARGTTGLRITTRDKKTFEPRSIAVIE